MIEAANALFASTEVRIEVFTSFHVHHHPGSPFTSNFFIGVASAGDASRIPYKSFIHANIEVAKAEALAYLATCRDEKVTKLAEAEQLAASLGYKLVKEAA